MQGHKDNPQSCAVVSGTGVVAERVIATLDNNSTKGGIVAEQRVVVAERGIVAKLGVVAKRGVVVTKGFIVTKLGVVAKRRDIVTERALSGVESSPSLVLLPNLASSSPTMCRVVWHCCQDWRCRPSVALLLLPSVR